jgi:hypothetical protein
MGSSKDGFTWINWVGIGLKRPTLWLGGNIRPHNKNNSGGREFETSARVGVDR